MGGGGGNDLYCDGLAVPLAASFWLYQLLLVYYCIQNTGMTEIRQGRQGIGYRLPVYTVQYDSSLIDEGSCYRLSVFLS